MMFAKNVLLGSLSFASVLIVGNWSGAIAQNADRYLTDREIDSLESEFQSEVDGFFRAQLNLRRKDARANELKKFRTSWAQFDSSITPFLGQWMASHGEAWIDIYPTQNKGKVCVAEGYYDYNMGRLVTIISIGTVADNKLLFVDAKRRKSVMIARDSVFSQSRSASREREFLAGYNIWNGKKSSFTYGFPLAFKPIQTSGEPILIEKNSDFTRLGCTTSLPSNNQTQISTQGLQNLPDGNYAYRQNINSSSGSDISRYFIFRKTGVSAVGYHFQPNTDWVYCWQGDLQGNSLVNIVNAEPRFGRGLSGYDFVNAKPENLLNYQQVDVRNLFAQRPNSKQRFQECISLFPSKKSNVIPSVPPSSTPVKPTETIAKYPTNDDFNAFEDKLQGNPESLVILRGNQAEQRRKFQNDWKALNPNAAKFLGAWYTGDRYFYVFPATVKGGTCVVTQDANGKLNMQVGTVLNKELRYGGGKGFFWRDRPNIVAARDSGSGSLYPIYATSGMPELSDGMITDMDRQNCIAKLPFEADAQYYKERGDKFRELGKKDEAISNYRKALELFRKQNLFAQIKTIESLLANLGGDKPTTKPITQKPTDIIYSGISPLYEDVKDPEYKPNKGMNPNFRVGLNAFEVVDNGQTVKLNSKVKSKVPTIIIIHGLDTDPTDPTKAEFRNLLKSVRYNTSTQVLVVDWGQGARAGLGTAAARIEATAGKVAELIEKYNLNPSEISLIGHSLGAHVSVDVALALQSQGSVKSITLLDAAVDIPTGYTVKNLSSISESTFIRAFYTSFAGSSSFAASANESYNIKFPSQTRRIPGGDAHGEAMTLLANSFQGDSNRKRNCIAEQFTKLDRQFPSIPQNAKRERPADGTKPAIDLYVDYDSNKWLYPKQIVSGLLDVNPEKGNCKLESDGTRTFDSIQNILK